MVSFVFCSFAFKIVNENGMKRKFYIFGVLAALCLLGTGYYAWTLYDAHCKQVAEWNEGAKAAFEEALWMEVNKRADIPIPNYSGDSRFCQVDRKGKLIKKWGEIPTERKGDLQKYPFAFGYGWRSFIDYSQKNGVLAAVTQFGEVLEIWNVKKNTHQVLKGKLGEPKFEVRSNYALPVGVKGSSDIQVTDRAIYVVFRGVSMKEEMLAHQKGKPLPQGGQTIRVFSLDGNPLKEYKLDHSVSGIWVDEQAGKMWALDVNSDEPLVEYRLK